MNLLKYLPACTFLAFSIRTIALGPSYSDVLALLVFGAVFCIMHLFEKKYQETLPVNEEIKKDVENLKGAISALKLVHSQRR